MNFVQVFSAQNEFEASLTKGYLESVGIKSTVSPVNSNGPGALNGYNTYYMLPYGVYVSKSDEAEARKVLVERK